MRIRNRALALLAATAAMLAPATLAGPAASAAPGEIQWMCGSTWPPRGWAVVEQVFVPQCPREGWGSTKNAARIIQLDGMPGGSQVTICSYDAPTGWVSTGYSSWLGCGQIPWGGTNQTSIIQVAGLPVGSQVTMCGYTPPRGWTAVASRKSVGCGYAPYSGDNTLTIRKLR